MSKNFLHRNGYSSGYSMVEILVVLAVVGLMGLGTTSMMNNMLKLSRKNEMNSGIQSFQANLEILLRNDDSWQNTIKLGGANAAFNCLWDGDNVECAPGVIVDFDVAERNPAPALAVAPPVARPIFYQGSSATAGITIQGEPCNAYSAGPGNDNCPLRYRLSATLECPGGEPDCLKPTITIDATLLINPASDQSLANRINTTEYNFQIVKTNEVKFEPLEVRHRITNSNGVGACNPGTPIPRPLGEVAYDVGNNIVAETGNSFTLAAGIYNCEVIATAYEAYDGFKIFLRAGGTDHAAGAGYSGNFSTATSVGKVDLSLAANTVIQVMHECTSTNPVPGVRQFDMGIPSRTGTGAASYSGGNTMTRVTCIRNR